MVAGDVVLYFPVGDFLTSKRLSSNVLVCSQRAAIGLKTASQRIIYFKKVTGL